MYRRAWIVPSVLVVLAGTAVRAQPAPVPPEPPPCDPQKDPACTPIAPVPDKPVVPTPPQPIPIPQPQTQPVAPPPPPPPTEAEQEALQDYQPSAVHLGGYFQPQFRMRQNSPQPNDEDGFRFARVRPQISAEAVAGNLELSAHMEVELQPAFAMIDAFGGVSRKLPHGGRVSLDVGQMRTPVSRAQIISDAYLSFVDKAQLASVAPDRDLGAKLTFVTPVLPLKIYAASFNGEGKNQIQNVNESYLYAGRAELTLLGKTAPLVESMFGGRFLSAGFSIARNKMTKGEAHEIIEYLGGDFTFAIMGLSGSVEYLQAKHRSDEADPALRTPPFKANAFNAQLAYMLPVRFPPLHHGRFEVAFRFEEIDRNDTFPIPQAGDPNQSVRETTLVLSYYLKQHSLKAQIAASHFVELEDRTSTNADATYPNDQIVLQLTYRLE